MLQVSIYGNVTHANKISYNGECVYSLEAWIQHLDGDYLIQQPCVNYLSISSNPTTYMWHPNPKIICLIFIQFKSLQTVKIIDFQKLFETRTSQSIHTIHIQLFVRLIIRKIGSTTNIWKLQKFYKFDY